MQFRSALALVTALLIGAANAADYKAGDISISNPVARATVPGQPSGAAYLILENRGKTADKLLSVSSPAAKDVQIHTMAMEGNIMKMREVPGVALPPGEVVMMKPGSGYHIMLLGLKQPLKAGDKLPLTLTFEKSGKVKVTADVEGGNAAGKTSSTDHSDHKLH